MNFKLIQICNDHESVLLAQDAGIDRIMLDLETKGKKKRQKNLDSVISNHTYKDIKYFRKMIKTSELMVRVNPLNNNSQLEIPVASKSIAFPVMCCETAAEPPIASFNS